MTFAERLLMIRASGDHERLNPDGRKKLQIGSKKCTEMLRQGPRQCHKIFDSLHSHFLQTMLNISRSLFIFFALCSLSCALPAYQRIGLRASF